jgi:hypothetical protein
LDHTSATISGQWATDNTGPDILINGVSTGNTSATFTSLSNFTINSGFVAGVNTLEFVVKDSGSIAGLLVASISGNANVANAVPEPTSLLLWSGLGVMGLVAARRRRKQDA